MRDNYTHLWFEMDLLTCGFKSDIYPLMFVLVKIDNFFFFLNMGVGSFVSKMIISICLFYGSDFIS